MPQDFQTPVTLTDEIKELVNEALASGNPMLLAVVDHDNRPLLSFRGSTQVLSDDQLGLWARNTQGGTLEAIRNNPHVAMMYRSPAVPLLQFQGRARITTDPGERRRIFDSAPEKEQQADPERKGAAVIIDIDKVEGILGFGSSGPRRTRMAR